MGTTNVDSPNLSFIPGQTLPARPPSYNTAPLNILNPFRVACNYSDDRLFVERAEILALHGACIGAFPYSSFVGLKKGLINFAWLPGGKTRFYTFSLFNGCVGAASGFAYMSGVHLSSKLRGGKDDPLNHFIGGFCLMLPIVIKNNTPRKLSWQGSIVGAVLASLKYICQEGAELANYPTNDPVKVTPCRYPELYVRSVMPPLPKAEERQKALAYQKKDF